MLYATLFTWAHLHNITQPALLRTTVQQYVDHFPCEECREHFAQLVHAHPFPLEHVQTPQDAHIWTWLTHNMVNLRLGKPWFPADRVQNASDTL
jgi:hypothetical protein